MLLSPDPILTEAGRGCGRSCSTWRGAHHPAPLLAARFLRRRGAPAEDPAAPALRGAGGVSALSSTRSGSHGLLQTLSFPAQTCANCRQRQALLSWSARPSGHACFSQPTAHPALVAAGGGPLPNWSMGCLVAAKRDLASCLCDLA